MSKRRYEASFLFTDQTACLTATDTERKFLIRETYHLYHIGAECYSIYRLEEELFAEGFRTPIGNRVRANAIHRMLTDVRFAGKVRYDGKMYDGFHACIVTMKEHKNQRTLCKNTTNVLIAPANTIGP